MRNFVAKHDFNRASVHEDKKKSWIPDIEEGVDEHMETLDKNNEQDELTSIMQNEYHRGVRASRIC